MKRMSVVVIENDIRLARQVAATVEEAGCNAVIVNDVASFEKYASITPEILLAIFDENFLDAIWSIVEQRERPIYCLVTSGCPSINNAVSAMQRGAFDYLCRPISQTRLREVLRAAIDQKSASNEIAPKKLGGLPAEVIARAGLNGFKGFVGLSPPMVEVYHKIRAVANSCATVFITGESGTGKEVCAEAIHATGTRINSKFMAINCGAIPSDLLESELFGHVKGAFTGAIQDRVGAVQSAEGGTLFLDEICEMELRLQVKLLRFLQTKQLQRVGSSRLQTSDVRIICATNRHPETEVTEGRFREDLYYRLQVVPIHLPPLRARGDDIILLAKAFIKQFSAEEGKVFDPLAMNIISQLLENNWRGNVRELQNVIRRAVIFSKVPNLELIPEAGKSFAAKHVPSSLSEKFGIAPQNFATIRINDKLGNIQRAVVENAILSSNGSVFGAAQVLGVSPSTIYRKRQRWKTALSA